MLLFPYALAEDAEQSMLSSLLVSFAPLLVVLIIFYFLVNRPNNQKEKAHNKMIRELEIGDKIITSGGIIGSITKINNKNSSLYLEISDGVTIKIMKNFVLEKISNK